MQAWRVTWILVKGVIVGCVLGALIHYGSRYLATLETVEVRNRAVACYNRQEYRDAVLTFEAAWAGSPALPSDKATYANAATEAGAAAYEAALRSHVGYDEALWLLTAAASQGTLDDQRQGYLVDACIATGEFDHAAELLAARRAAGALEGRFATLERKLAERRAYVPGAGGS